MRSELFCFSPKLATGQDDDDNADDKDEGKKVTIDLHFLS